MAGSETVTGRPAFHTTRWTMVVSAANGNVDALNQLCDVYWEPLYAHVRRMGYSTADAQDLTQSFIVRLLEKQLVTKVDPERGRFRTFLLTALNRYVINEWKSRQTQKAGGQLQTISLNVDLDEPSNRDAEPWHNLTPEREFDRRWALKVLETAFVDFENQIRESGKGDLFDKLSPFLTPHENAKSYEELAVECQQTVGALKMTVSRWRKELGECMRSVIRQTIASEQDIDDEIVRLLQALQPLG